MKRMFMLLLALSAMNVAYSQSPDPQLATQTPREPVLVDGQGNSDLHFSDLSPLPLASRASDWDRLRNRYGAYGSVNLNNHVANFQTLPGIPNCCSRFSGGNGTGGSFGGLIEIPISKSMVFGLRAGYTMNVAQLQSPEHSVVFVDSGSVPALFTHTINANPANIGVMPMLGYRVAGDLWLQGGPEFGYMIGRRYDQEERLMEPEAGTFSNGRRTRNEFAGNLPEANPFQASLTIGAAYELPLNKRHTLFAAPELFYSIGLTNLVEGLSWKANSLRFGMALKYSPREAWEQDPTPPEPVPAILAAGVTAVSVQPDGREIPLSTLFVEEIVSTNMRPLLNYVFFDENSAQIPSRYNRLTSGQADAFRTGSLYNYETLPTYYHVLNVIGRRLRDNTSATITIVGNNSNRGAEHGNTELSHRRAETVRNYLRDVWRISENRMEVTARDLPQSPSNQTEADGIAENRRVEIIPNMPGIVEPLFTADTMRRATASMIRFQPAVRSEAGVKEWALTAMQNGRAIRTFRGSGDVPEVLDWNVDAEQATAPRVGGTIEYQLEVEDMQGQISTSQIGAIPVELTPADQLRAERIAYKTVDRFSLILFNFDQAEPDGNNMRIIDRLRNRISPSATVTVTGYTDRIGDAEYNLRLSEERARMVASMLDATTAIVTGAGESSPLYTNKLPEGRFYNRTVDIVVETPVKQ